MATKEETEDRVNALVRDLNGEEKLYKILIPNWSPVDFTMGMRWMRNQLWEGFYVASKIDRSRKRLYLKSWEHGNDEPVWEQIQFNDND